MDPAKPEPEVMWWPATRRWNPHPPATSERFDATARCWWRSFADKSWRPGQQMTMPCCQWHKGHWILQWIEADVQICYDIVRSIFCSDVVSTWGSYINIASSFARCLIALPCGLMSSCHVTHACLNITTSFFFHVLPLSASILPYITRTSHLRMDDCCQK